MKFSNFLDALEEQEWQTERKLKRFLEKLRCDGQLKKLIIESKDRNKNSLLNFSATPTLNDLIILEKDDPTLHREFMDVLNEDDTVGIFSHGLSVFLSEFQEFQINNVNRVAMCKYVACKLFKSFHDL